MILAENELPLFETPAAATAYSLDAILPIFAKWMHLNLINWSQEVLVDFT